MSGSEKQKTILLVDDEAIIAMAEKMTLEKFGYEVIVANSGEAAVAVVEKTPVIDLILMDINLGAGMDGSEAAKIILGRRDLPVVFLSSHMEPEVVAKTEKITSYGYVVKASSGTVLDASIKMAFKLFEAKKNGKEKECQRETAFEALQVSLEKYRILFESFPLGISISDKSGKIIEGNLQSELLLGITRDVHTHRRIDSKEWQIIRKDGTPMPVDEYASARALRENRLIENVEMGIVKDKDKITWISVTAAPIPLEGYGVAITYGDITERKRVEEALRNSENKFSKAFRASPDVLVISRLADGLIIEANDSWDRLFGYSREDVIGRKSIELELFANPEDRQKIVAQLHAQKIVRDFEVEIRRKSGDVRQVTLSVETIEIDSEPCILTIIHDITERKRAEEALRENEEKFRGMAEQLEDVLFATDDNGIITYLSPSTSRMFGCHPEEMIGRKFIEFLPESEIPKAVQAFQNAVSTGQPSRNLSLLMKRRDNSIFNGEIKGSPLAKKWGFAGTLGLIRDITEYKKAEAALQESEERYRTLIENASDLVYRTDQSGRFTYINRAGLRFTGYEEGEFIGRFYPSLIRPDMRNRAVRVFIQQIRKRTPNTYSEFPILAKDGRELWLGQNTQLIVQNGQVTGFQAVSRDITERRRAEAEIDRQLAEKVLMLKEVHHRIKNNIASVGSLISLRLQSVTNPEAIAVLQDAIGRVDSIRILYDKLLLSEDYKDVSVKNYIESLSETAVTLFPGKSKITLEKRIADFQLDSKRLFPIGIIINELITNAMKYAFDRKKSGLIQLSLAKVDSHVTLIIQDNGSALPDDFDLNESKGFGLMLVKMLSQQLGGSFSIEKHKGTRCTVEFDV